VHDTAPKTFVSGMLVMNTKRIIRYFVGITILCAVTSCIVLIATRHSTIDEYESDLQEIRACNSVDNNMKVWYSKVGRTVEIKSGSSVSRGIVNALLAIMQKHKVIRGKMHFMVLPEAIISLSGTENSTRNNIKIEIYSEGIVEYKSHLYEISPQQYSEIIKRVEMAFMEFDKN